MVSSSKLEAPWYAIYLIQDLFSLRHDKWRKCNRPLLVQDVNTLPPPESLRQAQTYHRLYIARYLPQCSSVTICNGRAFSLSKLNQVDCPLPNHFHASFQNQDKCFRSIRLLHNIVHFSTKQDTFRVSNVLESCRLRHLRSFTSAVNETSEV